jgi:hypothetical protein
MNYKEAAAKLNEFNDFIGCIQMNIALKYMGLESNNVTFKEFTESLLNIKFPIEFYVHGLKFTNNYKPNQL